MHLDSGPPYPTKKNKPVALPSREEIERVAYCVGVYLSAFSKEPFDEKWSVDGVKMPGLLLNPKTTSEFIKELLDDKSTVITSLPDGTEKVRVRNALVLNHVAKTLSCAMTNYLVSTNWISEGELINLQDLKILLEKKNKNQVEFVVPYPLNKIISSYIDVVNTPESLVLMGYQDEGQDDLCSRIKFLRLLPDIVLPDYIWPRLLTRYITINSPKSLGRQNALTTVVIEVKNYLSEDDLNRITGFIDPSEYTIYLGEIAKVGGFSKNFRANLFTGIEYLKLLISIPDDKKDILSVSELMPRQIVFFTLEGTTIAEREQENPSQSKFYTMIKGIAEPLETYYEESILEFRDKNNKKMFLTNIKIVSPVSD